MTSVKIIQTLISVALASATTLTALTACSGAEDIAADAPETKLTPTEVAELCQNAARNASTADGVAYDALTVYAHEVPTDAITGQTFDSEISGILSNDEYIGEFTFRCTIDGSDAQVSNFYFPPKNFLAPQSESSPTRQAQRQHAQPQQPQAQAVDPQRIDPRNNGAGVTGRDDNLGIYYHNKQDWLFLEAPGKVVPGAKIYNVNKSYCSTGFIASRENRTFIVTAGHCGDVGDQFYVNDQYGGSLVVGEMVESFYERDNTGFIGTDIGLIEIYDDAKPYVDSALPVNSRLKGWITPAQAGQGNMTICRLGATTGYSCGKFVEVDRAGQFVFRNIADRGDSGGAIFAFDGTDAWALGVTSNGSDYNKTLTSGMEIAGAMQHWGLTLHG